MQVSNGLEFDDGRHKSLAEKGWARRAVVVRGLGPCGGADLEELPGREEYGGDEDGALEKVCSEKTPPLKPSASCNKHIQQWRMVCESRKKNNTLRV